MIDIENALFTIVTETVEAHYPEAQLLSEPINAPAKFPTVVFWEMDNSVYRKTMDGEHKEHHAQVAYSLDVFSNADAGGKMVCRDILRLVDAELMRRGLVRMAYGFTRNADSRICRATARYQAVVGEDFRVYKN